MSDEDLVKRLRASIMPSNNLKQRAADAIERLTRERDEAQHDHASAMRASLQMKARAEAAERKAEKLQAALEPFAEKHLYPDDIDPSYAAYIRADEDWDEDRNDNEVDDCWIRRGWIRRARAALKETE